MLRRRLLDELGEAEESPRIRFDHLGRYSFANELREGEQSIRIFCAWV
jgi:hypothetical protein